MSAPGIARLWSVLLTLAAGPTAAADAPRLEEGASFPDLLLPAIDDGRARSIADFRGEKVVLHVFASW